MAVELVVPEAGESIREVQIGRWLKQPGEFVQKDEPVVEIESDKVTFELFAPVSGIVGDLLKGDGEVAAVGEVIGSLTEAAGPAATETASGPAHAPQPDAPTEPEATPVSRATTEARVMPAAQRMLEEAGVTAEQVPASGPGGRVLKEDVRKFLAERAAPAAAAPAKAPPAKAPAADGHAGFREEEAVPMTPMRRRIAERLVAAQQTAAMLTTFNECDMSAVMELRRVHQDAFTKQYQVKLGFMSFFVKACVDALKRIPELNAELRGTDIIYHNYYDIGIAVSGKKGLAVPIVRNAERLSFAEIEQKIGDFGARARENKLELEELQGGTFTITNGGVFGSMMSTPILNPPQSGILGLHAINERPVAVDGQVVIRPMMYLALTYDHRIVDGREAVTFLKRIKEVIENPTRMLIEI